MTMAKTVSPRQRAEQLSASLPPLLLQAERVAASVAQGVHGRRRVGTGEAFWQFRDYQPGDPPVSIDWRQSAKADRVFVRQMEWEAAQSVWCWRDGSASMDWRSSDKLPTKRARAELLMLALMVLMIRAGEHVTMLGTGLPPAANRGTIARLSELLRREETGGAKDLPPPEPLPRNAQALLLGDFLSDPAEIEKTLRSFAERGVKGHLVQVLDPAEETLPYQGRVRFEGLQGERPWLLSRAEGVREAYQHKLHAQSDAIRDIARRTGWRCTWHRTDRSPQTALLAVYSALSAHY
jgi:uncharacterized protein (DUF58 family)